MTPLLLCPFGGEVSGRENDKLSILGLRKTSLSKSHRQTRVSSPTDPRRYVTELAPMNVK